MLSLRSEGSRLPQHLHFKYPLATYPIAVGVLGNHWTFTFFRHSVFQQVSVYGWVCVCMCVFECVCVCVCVWDRQYANFLTATILWEKLNSSLIWKNNSSRRNHRKDAEFDFCLVLKKRIHLFLICLIIVLLFFCELISYNVVEITILYLTRALIICQSQGSGNWVKSSHLES